MEIVIVLVTDRVTIDAREKLRFWGEYNLMARRAFSMAEERIGGPPIEDQKVGLKGRVTEIHNGCTYPRLRKCFRLKLGLLEGNR